MCVYFLTLLTRGMLEPLVVEKYSIIASNLTNHMSITEKVIIDFGAHKVQTDGQTECKVKNYIQGIFKDQL